MIIDNKEVLDAVLEVLRNDQTLSTYVKKISHGNMNASRAIFPFIEVGNFHISPVTLRASSVYIQYSIEIICGTSSLAPGVALKGHGGKKGICDLCDDIARAVHGSAFGGLFDPVESVRYDQNHFSKNTETTKLALLTFFANRWTQL